jgi:hypothetical protein
MSMITTLKAQAFSDTGTYDDAEALFCAVRKGGTRHLLTERKFFAQSVWNEYAHNTCINEAEHIFEKREEWSFSKTVDIWRIYFIPVTDGYHIVRVRYENQVGTWYARHRDDTCRAF